MMKKEDLQTTRPACANASAGKPTFAIASAGKPEEQKAESDELKI